MAKRTRKKKQTLPVLFNCTERAYSTWSAAEQAAAAAAYHEVVDMLIPENIPADADIEGLQELIGAYFGAIFDTANEEYQSSNIPPVACVAGEPTFVFSLINHLEGAGMRCIAPVWKRGEDGAQEFSLFRNYSSESNWQQEEVEGGGDEENLQQALAQLSQMLSGEGGEELAQQLLQSAFEQGEGESEGGKMFNLADYMGEGEDEDDDDEEEEDEDDSEAAEGGEDKAVEEAKEEKPKKEKKGKKEGKGKKEKKASKDKKKKK